MNRKKQKKQQNQENRFDLLAEETICHVFSYLNKSSLRNTYTVSKQFNFFSQKMYLKKFPLLDYTKPVATKKLQNNHSITGMTALTDTLLMAHHSTEIIIIDITNGEIVRALPTDYPVTSLIKLEGDNIAAVYHDKVHILNYETGKRVRKIELLVYDPESCTALHDFLVMGYTLGKIDIWNYKLGKKINTIQSYSNSTVSCMVQLNDRKFISGHFDGSMRIWNSLTGEPHAILGPDNPHIVDKRGIRGIVVLSDHLLVSRHKNGCIKIWDYKENKCIQTIFDKKNHLPQANKYLAKLSEKHLLCVDSHGKMEIWHYDQGIFTKSFEKLDMGDNILDCMVLNNQIVISRRNEGLEIISFPTIKNKLVLDYVEVKEEKPANTKCLMM